MTADQAQWKPWMVRQYDLFVQENMADVRRVLWHPILISWVELERLCSFENTVRVTFSLYLSGRSSFS